MHKVLKLLKIGFIFFKQNQNSLFYFFLLTLLSGILWQNCEPQRRDELSRLFFGPGAALRPAGVTLSLQERAFLLSHTHSRWETHFSVCVRGHSTFNKKWSGSSLTSVGSLEFPVLVPSRAAFLFIMCYSVLNIMHYCYY